MITERDNIKCQTSLEMIDASSLEPKSKADLKESVEEAKLNLNGRSLDERVLSIAQNQFDTTRFLADIIIKFNDIAKDVATKKPVERSWKDVVIVTRWPLCLLGSVISVCMIFQPEIVSLAKAVVSCLM